MVSLLHLRISGWQTLLGLHFREGLFPFSAQNLPPASRAHQVLKHLRHLGLESCI
jgi:hypothetical protein